MVENINLTPWKKLIVQTGEAKKSGETYEPTKQDVSTAFGGKKTTASSKTSSTASKTKKTVEESTVSETTAPPLPTINLFESDAFKESTNVMGLPSQPPGSTTQAVDVPTTTATIPRYSRSGTTATPQELMEVDHTRSSTGIVTGSMYDTQRQQEEQRAAAYRAGTTAEERVRYEIYQPYQQNLQQETQDVYNREYNRLMMERAQQLGISQDESGQYVATNPRQWQLLTIYQSIARTKAEEKAREYAKVRSRQLGDTIEAEALQIYQEEYGKQGMVVVKDQESGQYQVMTREEYQRQQLRGLLEERYQEMPLPERTAKIAMETVLNIGNFGMWWDTITKGPAAGYEHLMDYRTSIAQKRYEGDMFGALMVTPSVTNIAIPFTIVGGLSAGMPFAIAKIAARSATAGKIIEKAVSVGGRIMFGSYLGTELGMITGTSVLQGLDAGIKQAGDAAIRLMSGYAGYRMFRPGGEPIKTSVRKSTTEWVYNTEKGTFTGQRYINLFGKKIVWQRSPVVLSTRGVTDMTGSPSEPFGGREPFTGINKWYMTTGKGWQPQTGISFPGEYTGRQPSIWVAPKPMIIDYGIRGVPALKIDLSFTALTESQSDFMRNLYFKQLGGKTPTTIEQVFTAYEKKWGRGIYRPAEPRRIERKPEWKPSYKIDVDIKTGITEVQRGTDWFYKTSLEKPVPTTGIYWKTGRELSTKVWPKPKVYGAYETRYIVVDWTDYFKGLILGRVKSTGKPITPTKTKRIYTMQDIIKPEPIEGTPTGGGRQQTILKTKTITKQEQVLQLDQQYQTLQQKDYLVTMLQQESVSGILTTKASTQQMGMLYGVTPLSIQKKSTKQMIGFASGQAVADAQTEKQIMTLVFGQTEGEAQQQKKIRLQTQSDIPLPKLDTKTRFVPPAFDMDIFFKTPIPEPLPLEIKTKPPKKEKGGLIFGTGTNIFTGKETGYIPQVLKTQYSNGRRIRGKEWINLTNNAYSREDALAVAAHTADNTAKRSIRVIPSEKKPSKRPTNIKSWTDQMFEYKQKQNDVFVETNLFAIDSPGEIREISQKGWESQMRNGLKHKKGTKNQGFTIKTPNIKGIENKIRRRLSK